MEIKLNVNSEELLEGDLIITDGGNMYTILYNGYSDDFDFVLYSFTDNEIVLLIKSIDLHTDVVDYLLTECGESIINVVSNEDLILIDRKRYNEEKLQCVKN